jgi:16S rRNA (uracil1498-N3)-methyltransferase
MTHSSIRLFVDMPLIPGLALGLSDRQAHYLGNVMRLSAGDEIRMFNGVHGEWSARIKSLSKGVALLDLLQQTRVQAPEPDCWLCFALLKRQKTDLVVEKATELGASVIQPVITARTQADHVNPDRLRAIAIEAAEQCERLSVPELRPPIKFPALLAGWPAERTLYLADERRTARYLRPQTGAAALMVGPEGGFTGPEIEAIGAHPIVTRVSLGRRILRAETAAIAGLALLLASDPPEEERIV